MGHSHLSCSLYDVINSDMEKHLSQSTYVIEVGVFGCMVFAS